MAVQNQNPTDNRLADALATLTWLRGDGASPSPVDSVAGVPNPQQAIQQTLQRLAGLRAGFTSDELVKTLKERFRPVKDEEGHEKLEFVPLTPFPSSDRGPIAAADKPDEVEAQFVAAAQSLLPRVDVLLNDLAKAAKDELNTDVQELRDTLKINLDAFTSGGIARPDGGELMKALNKGVDDLGIDLNIIPVGGNSKTLRVINPENRAITAKYLLLRGLIDSITAAGAGLSDLRDNDIHRVFEQVEVALRNCSERIRSLYSSARSFGGVTVLERIMVEPLSSSNRLRGAATLHELLVALSKLVAGDAARLLESGGLIGAGFVASRADYFKEALSKVRASRPAFSRVEDFADDFINQRLDDLIQQLTLVVALLGLVKPVMPVFATGSADETSPPEPVASMSSDSGPEIDPENEFGLGSLSSTPAKPDETQQEKKLSQPKEDPHGHAKGHKRIS